MADPQKTLIAVVNHDSVFLNLIKQILQSDGYDALICPEGTLAHRTIVDEKPDLVLLDTWLEHRESGWTLLQTLKLDQATQHIPILLCTSDPQTVKSRITDIQRLGSVEVLSKPFDPEALLQKIKKMVTTNRRLAEGTPSSDGRRPARGSGRSARRSR